MVGVLPVAKRPADELFAEFVLRCLPGSDDLVEEALRRCGGGVEEAFLGVVVVVDEGGVDVGGAGDGADGGAGVAVFGERRAGFAENPGGEHAAFGTAHQGGQHLGRRRRGAAVIGVLCSGALLEFFSWRSAFGLNVVLAILAIGGTLKVVPESADKDAPRLDIGGAILAVAGLVAVVYSIIEAPTAGWLSASTLAGLGLGLLVLAGFVAFELRQATPMLNPRIFTRRGLSAGSISIFVQFFAFFGFIFLVLQYLQIVRNAPAFAAAASMLPLAVTMMPASRLAPKAAAKFGSRPVCVTGLALIAAALAILAQLGSNSSYWILAVGLLVLGAGMGAAMTPATSAITSALPQEQQGVASAMNDLSREVGGALGIAVIGSIMTAIYRGHLAVTGVPAAVLDRARDSLAAASRIGGLVSAQANTAFIDGIHIALLAAAGTAILAALAVAALLPRRDIITDTDSDAENHDELTAAAPARP